MRRAVIVRGVRTPFVRAFTDFTKLDTIDLGGDRRDLSRFGDLTDEPEGARGGNDWMKGGAGEDRMWGNGGDDEMFGGKIGVGNATRLDDEKPGITIDPGDISPGQFHQALALEHEVGLEDLLAKVFEHGEV